MTLLDRIIKARQNILRQGGHIEALHFGIDAEREFHTAMENLRLAPIFEKWRGIPLEIPPERGDPTRDYCAFRWKRDERSPAILFEIIQP